MIAFPVEIIIQFGFGNNQGNDTKKKNDQSRDKYIYQKYFFYFFIQKMFEKNKKKKKINPEKHIGNDKDIFPITDLLIAEHQGNKTKTMDREGNGKKVF